MFKVYSPAFVKNQLYLYLFLLELFYDLKFLLSTQKHFSPQRTETEKREKLFPVTKFIFPFLQK